MIFAILFQHLLIRSCPYSFTSPFTIIVLSFHIVSYHFICMSYTSHLHFFHTSYALHSMYVSCTFHTFQDVIVFHDPFIILLYSFRHPFITLLTPFKVDSSLWGFHYHAILFHFYQRSRISSFLEKFLVAGTLPTKLFLRNWRIWSFGGRFCFVCLSPTVGPRVWIQCIDTNWYLQLMSSGGTNHCSAIWRMHLKNSRTDPLSFNFCNA